MEGVEVIHYDAGTNIGSYNKATATQFSDCTPCEYLEGLLRQPLTRNNNPHYLFFLTEWSEDHFVLWVEAFKERSQDGWNAERWALEFRCNSAKSNQEFAGLKMHLAWFMFLNTDRAIGESAVNFTKRVLDSCADLSAQSERENQAA